ncbi:branched-chain amino acid aminotransferase II [Zopfia rhizophila CBS 207.26]|uniref:Branched-chain amino acid aminotransferase II n=1 Tax=Zopfia rhizophila CBS 207.26 TaxID=1314779 RepID=A0A6A6D9I8_9PEZI|nr:branched-chain amino acid aminotransferase II [Zopfia rhizophila CBS 207.26]
MPFPPSPRDGIEWSKLSAAIQVNGHIQSRWSRETGIWSEPEFIQDPFLRVHGLAPVFHYGQEAYEGLKREAFRALGGEIHIVRPDFHASRLKHSSSLVSIPPIPKEHFLRCVHLAVGINAEFVPPNDTEGMLYIRPVVFGSGACILLDSTDEYPFCVYIITAGAYHGVEPLDALILEDFDRTAPRGTGSGKVGGNYSPVMLAKSEGFDITLHLDSQTRSEIEEFSTSAFVGVKVDGANITLVVPDSQNVMSSVTCDSVQHLARSLRWAVERRPIEYEELLHFSEIMACGTAVTLVPIKSITRKSTPDKFIYQNGNKEPGPCARKLAAMLQDIHKGRAKDTFGWLTEKMALPPQWGVEYIGIITPMNMKKSG